MASRPSVGKAPPTRGASTTPANLIFKVGGQGFLLTRQFRRPPWAKLVDTHAASSRPLLRQAARDQITFAAKLRRTFEHEIAPVGQKFRPSDTVERVVTLIAQRKLFLFRLGEAPPVPKSAAQIRIDVAPVRPPAVSDVAPVDLGERFAIVLEGIREVPLRQLGAEAGELIAALAVGGAVLRIAALLAAWIASHFTPVGWIIDAGMIGYGIWCVGLGFIDTMKRLLEIARAIKSARTRADLKAQSLPLAKLFIEAGVTALLAFLLKGVDKRKRGGGGGTEQAPAAPTPPPRQKPAPVQGKTAAPAGGPGTAMQTYYPPNRGFAGVPENKTLGTGTVIDRYGYDGGTFVSPKGTPAWARALPPGTTDKPYNIYEVVKPIEVQSGKAAPWFGQIGGGTQHELPMTIEQALKSGAIKRIGP